MTGKVEIYKHDKWNMMHVEVRGKQIIVREISDQWGEETHQFLARPEMMHWVEHRFSPERFEGENTEREALIAKFREI